MIPAPDRPVIDDSELEALLAFDRALAAGDDPAASAGCATFLEPVHECQRLLEAVWPRSVAQSLKLPKKFARFAIVRELGRGGFGVVFLAEDSVLGRQVALKVPRPEVLVTPEVRRRFLREAEAASRLDHPHIVPVYEVGEEGLICYIASAYCEGPTLGEWLRLQTASVPIRVASRLVAVLAAAVAHAHERGILHRDLKPGNILLQQPRGNASATERISDELGFIPRVCDFGLAKLLDQISDETRSGVPIGSPVYMAPEQAAGRLREHGPATDVYALGVILYELLTGTPPHRGETDLETLRLVSDQDPLSPRALRPGLPRDLETIVLKCLEKRPAARYSSALELTEDLRRFLAGKPVKARPIAAWERAGKWARRRPIHAALALVLGASALAVLIGLEWARVREKRHFDEIRVADERLRRSETEAQNQRALADRERLLAAYQHLAANQLKLAGSLVERQEYEPAMSILQTLRPPAGLPDLRGFSWHYLNRIIRPLVPILPALPQRIRAVTYARDGRTIALADDANNTFVIDCETGRLRELHSRHKFPLCVRLLFSSDGRTLASLSHPIGKSDTEVKLWDVASGAELEGITEYLGFCYEMLFSPDGGMLVTIDGVGSGPQAPLRSWILSKERKRVTLGETILADELKARLSPGSRVADSAGGPFRLSGVLAVTAEDDSTLAVRVETGEVRLYTTKSGYCKAVCSLLGSEVVFIPRTDLAVPYTQTAVDEIGRVAIAVTGAARARPIRHGGPVLCARFSRDGRTAAVQEPYPGRSQGKLRVIDVATGRVDVESPWGDLWDACSFDFIPGRDSLLAVGKDARARLWDYGHSRGPTALDGHTKEVWGPAFSPDGRTEEVWGLAFSPDGRTLVSSSDDHTLKLWDVASGVEQRTLEGHSSLVTAVAYSPDGELLASASYDKTIRLWKASSGVPVATLSGHTARVRTLAFSPDGETLVSAGEDFGIRIWDLATGHELRAPLGGHTSTVFSVVFAPDGKAIYSGALDETIRVWEPKDGRLRATWRAEEHVYSLAISPDGQTLAAGYRHGTISLWDVARQQAGLVLHGGNVGDVLGVAFSRDGHTLASAGRDHSVRLWDPVNGQEVLTLKGHAAPVNGIAFSPDGTILATGSHDGAIKLWRASPGTTDQETGATTRP